MWTSVCVAHLLLWEWYILAVSLPSTFSVFCDRSCISCCGFWEHRIIEWGSCAQVVDLVFFTAPGPPPAFTGLGSERWDRWKCAGVAASVQPAQCYRKCQECWIRCNGVCIRHSNALAILVLHLAPTSLKNCFWEQAGDLLWWFAFWAPWKWAVWFLSWLLA